MNDLAAGIPAMVLDADSRAATIQCNAALTVGMNYLIEGVGLQFLAGKVIWARAGKAGLFFQHPIHPEMLERLRPSPTQSGTISLQLVTAHSAGDVPRSEPFPPGGG